VAALCGITGEVSFYSTWHYSISGGERYPVATGSNHGEAAVVDKPPGHRSRFGRSTSTFSESFVKHRGRGSTSEARMNCTAVSLHRVHQRVLETNGPLGSGSQGVPQ
jgi:hypothetical protein